MIVVVDMHIHTKYSDGDKTVEEVLKMGEKLGLEYISITDHNTCKQYKDNALNKNIFSGRIIKGVEMNATFKDRQIEILGYNIKDDKIIEEWSQKFFSREVLKKQQEELRQQIDETLSAMEDKANATKAQKQKNIKKIKDLIEKLKIEAKEAKARGASKAEITKINKSVAELLKVITNYQLNN